VLSTLIFLSPLELPPQQRCDDVIQILVDEFVFHNFSFEQSSSFSDSTMLNLRPASSTHSSSPRNGSQPRVVQTLLDNERSERTRIAAEQTHCLDRAQQRLCGSKADAQYSTRLQTQLSVQQSNRTERHVTSLQIEEWKARDVIQNTAAVIGEKLRCAHAETLRLQIDREKRSERSLLGIANLGISHLIGINTSHVLAIESSVQYASAVDATVEAAVVASPEDALLFRILRANADEMSKSHTYRRCTPHNVRHGEKDASHRGPLASVFEALCEDGVEL